MAGADLALQGRRPLVRAAGCLSVVGPMSPSSPDARGRGGPARLESELADKARAWAETTARAQGLSECITDEAVIAQVAVLLGSGRHPVCSGAPDRLDA